MGDPGYGGDRLAHLSDDKDRSYARAVKKGIFHNSAYKHLPCIRRMLDLPCQGKPADDQIRKLYARLPNNGGVGILRNRFDLLFYNNWKEKQVFGLYGLLDYDLRGMVILLFPEAGHRPHKLRGRIRSKRGLYNQQPAHLPGSNVRAGRVC